jgi:hypothetical protein
LIEYISGSLSARLFLLLTLAYFQSGCGGGGSKSKPPEPVVTGVEMSWEEADWDNADWQ